MKLVTFQPSDGGPRVGALETSRVVDLSAGGLPDSMEGFIEAGDGVLKRARELVSQTQVNAFDIESVKLLAPLSRPNSLRDFIAFEDHAKAGAQRRGEELSPTWHERPLYYKGNHRSLLGPGEDIVKPAFTDELDFELEVAAIVGSKGRDLSEKQAGDAIFGFTILNDWSARDVQRTEMAARLGPAKSKDFATSLGPCILTADEVGPRPELKMVARLNGKVICEANLGEAKWSFPQMIAFVSQGETIWPTDIFGSGTPFGGCLLDQQSGWLKPEDVVELEVENIGILRNRVRGPA